MDETLVSPTRSVPTWATAVFAGLGLLFAGSFLYMGYAAYVRTVTDAPITQALQAEVQEARRHLVELERQLQDREALIARYQISEERHESQMRELRDTVILREAELDDLRNQLVLHEKDSVTFRRARAQAEDFAGVFRSPVTRVVVLNGSDTAPTASGLLFEDPASGSAFFYGYNVPPPPRGQVYQLWAIGTAPVSAGLFVADTGQKARMSIKRSAAFSGVTKFAVTLEPQGGQTQPTGPVILSGSR